MVRAGVASLRGCRRGCRGKQVAIGSLSSRVSATCLSWVTSQTVGSIRTGDLSAALSGPLGGPRGEYLGHWPGQLSASKLPGSPRSGCSPSWRLTYFVLFHRPSGGRAASACRLRCSVSRFDLSRVSAAFHSIGLRVEGTDRLMYRRSRNLTLLGPIDHLGVSWSQPTIWPCRMVTANRSDISQSLIAEDHHSPCRRLGLDEQRRLGGRLGFRNKI